MNANKALLVLIRLCVTFVLVWSGRRIHRQSLTRRQFFPPERGGGRIAPFSTQYSNHFTSLLRLLGGNGLLGGNWAPGRTEWERKASDKATLPRPHLA